MVNTLWSISESAQRLILHINFYVPQISSGSQRQLYRSRWKEWIRRNVSPSRLPENASLKSQLSSTAINSSERHWLSCSPATIATISFALSPIAIEWLPPWLIARSNGAALALFNAWRSCLTLQQLRIRRVRKGRELELQRYSWPGSVVTDSNQPRSMIEGPAGPKKAQILGRSCSTTKSIEPRLKMNKPRLFMLHTNITSRVIIKSLIADILVWCLVQHTSTFKLSPA